MISVPDAPLSLYSVFVVVFLAGNAVIKHLIDAWNIPKLSILNSIQILLKLT